MGKKVNISRAEWELMQLLWQKSPLTSRQLVEGLQGANKWSPKTIRTLLNRLVSKKAIGCEKAGREYRYYPLVQREEQVGSEIMDFFKRIGQGALSPALAAFIEQQPLNPDEIEKLKELLDKKEAKQ